MARMTIALILAAASLTAISGCGRPELDPNLQAQLQAWERNEQAKRDDAKPVKVIDLRAVQGKSIENLASVEAYTPGVASPPTPMPVYTPPKPWWGKALDTVLGLGKKAGDVVLGVSIAREAGDVLKEGYQAAGDKTSAGGNLYSGTNAGDNRDNPVSAVTNGVLP